MIAYFGTTMPAFLSPLYNSDTMMSDAAAIYFVLPSAVVDQEMEMNDVHPMVTCSEAQEGMLIDFPPSTAGSSVCASTLHNDVTAPLIANEVMMGDAAVSSSEEGNRAGKIVADLAHRAEPLEVYLEEEEEKAPTVKQETDHGIQQSNLPIGSLYQ